MSDTLHQNFYGLLVEIIDPVYLPKTPRKYFELFDYSLSSDCRLGSYDLKTIQYLHPLNIYIRVVAKETEYLSNNINPDNIRLDLDPYNSPHISVDYPDIPQLHSLHDSKYDYRYMSEDSVAKFLSCNKWISEKNKNDYHSSYWWLSEFELRKDLCRLALLKNINQKVEILKRLSHYPHYDQTRAREIVPRYIDDPKLREQIINLYTPIEKSIPPDTTLHSELPSSLKAKWVHTGGPGGGDFNLLKLITSRSGIKYLFAGAADNELFRSSDNGGNWIKITIGSIHNHVVSFFSHNNYLFVGTGVVISSKDSTKIYGANSDSSGRFLIDNIPPGVYRAKASLIRYKSRSRQNIILNPAFNNIKIDTIMLTPTGITTNEVKVIAQKERIVYDKENSNRVIINPDKDWGNNALDLLENTPMVHIDMDETSISLMGQEGTVIYIDGVPGKFSGIESLKDLKLLPSLSIDKFELYFNGSVEFGEYSTGGVIVSVTFAAQDFR